MFSILLSVAIFGSCVLIHRALYRTLGVVQKNFFATVMLFFIGFGLHLWIAINNVIPLTLSLPLTSMMVYIIATMVYLLLFLSVFLADLSPSFQIIGLLRTHRHLTAAELESHFNNQTLIIKRIEQLKTDNYVGEKNHRYTMLPRGIRLYRLLEIYRSLLSWPEGG